MCAQPGGQVIRTPKLYLCLSLACVLSSVLLVMSSPFISASDHPGLVTDGATGCPGYVAQGSLARHEFTVTNRSRRPVHLLGVETSCSCTSVNFQPAHLAPGESHRVPIDFSVGESRGLTTTQASVMYRIDGERETRSLRLRLTANVLPDIEISHSAIRFERGSPYRKMVRLTSGILDSFEVIRVDCTHRCFLASAETVAQNEVAVVVEMEPSCWKGDSKMATLVIATNSQAQPLIEIPLVPLW